MIYKHCILEVHDCATDILLNTEEKLLKFQTIEQAEEYDFKIVQKIAAKNLQYPGNGRIYVDFSTRELTADEISFCGLPA